MAQRCDERGSGKRCHRPSKGSIGMLRYCYPCFAALIGWRANDRRLKQVRPVVGSGSV